MSYFKTDAKWEDQFVQEAIDLEEKLSQMGAEGLGKSKLRLLFENNLLDWNKYQTWFCQNLGCSSFKSSVTYNQLLYLKSTAKETYNQYSSFDFWNEDLVPVFSWNNQLYVFGIEYSSKLSEIQNHVFILTPPEILQKLSDEIFTKSSSTTNELLNKTTEESTGGKIEGLDLNYKSPTMNFDSLNVSTQNTEITQAAAPLATVNTKGEQSIWEFITERHEENSFEAKKQFSAYIVLKIKDNKTQVYKMDSELKKKNLNESIFNYSLSDNNPFARVAKTGISESFGLSQLNLNILDFKYACITALKTGQQTVGFLVGFKNKNLSDTDLSLLEELAHESAA